MTEVPGPKDRRRWEISLQPGDDIVTITEDASVWSLLSRFLTPDDGDLIRRAIYEFRSCIAQSWRSNRLLLAGDAAHQMPPFMGQGMCTGMRDAANLSWKLIDVIEGKANADLLDTYESERVPHVQAYVDMAVRLGGLINTSNTKAALKEAFPQADGSAKIKSIQPSLGPGFSIANDEKARRMFHQWKMPDGSLSDENTHGKTVMFVLPGYVPETPPNNIVLQIAETGLPAETALSQLNAVAAFVRPDHYILGTAQSADDISALLALRDHFYID